MKIPDPMIPLITIIVASNSVRRRAKVVVGPSLMDLGPPGKIRGEIRAVSISQDARARNRNRGYAPCIMPRLVQRLALALFFLCLATGAAGPAAPVARQRKNRARARRCTRRGIMHGAYPRFRFRARASWDMLTARISPRIFPGGPRSMSDGPTTTFARRLTLFDATMIVISGIIGSGIFINPYVVAQAVHTPFLILGVWIAGGVIALFGAFVFAELSTVMPRVGGQYAFFREAFSPIVAFLYGWGLLLIVQSGATAAVAVAFAQYVARLVDLPTGAAPWLAAAILLAVAAFHALGIKPGAVLINVITFAKTLALAALIVGAFLLTRGSGLTFETLTPPDLGGGLPLLSAFFAGLVPAMF